MARRKPYEKIDINVEPFLSIMAIVLKLISLILVVIVMRIAMNPNAKRIPTFPGLYSGHGNEMNPKIPSYIDCHPDGLTLYSSDVPAGAQVHWDDLQRPDNAVNQLLDKVQQHKDDEYIVVMVRPSSLKFYRTVRNLIEKRPIDVGYDAIDANFKVDWDAAEKALAISPD
ncbi:MAG: hypothetical protein ABSD58_05145 [Verrucomicrobiia bacterium]|jgi:hypothetical protein